MIYGRKKIEIVHNVQKYRRGDMQKSTQLKVKNPQTPLNYELYCDIMFKLDMRRSGRLLPRQVISTEYVRKSGGNNSE